MWVNRRSQGNLIFERLDRYVANIEWKLLYPVAQVKSLEFFDSNYRSIQLDLSITCSKTATRKLGFRFEPHWAMEDDCSECVK